MAQQSLVGQDLLSIKDLWSQSVRHTALGRTPLGEGSTRRKDLYLTAHNTHTRQISMPPAGFELSFFLCDSPQWTRASSFTRYLDHTQELTTLCRTSLDERSARHSDLYLTTTNTHNRQTSMPPVGFEPTISAGADLRLRRRGHWERLCSVSTR